MSADRYPHSAWLALGSNRLDREAALRSAIAALGNLGLVAAASSIWETAPVGFAAQALFLNAAAELRTALTPQELLAALLHIERDHGRDRNQSVRNGPRILDLDILLVAADGQPVIAQSPDLQLPHPAMHERRFVLAPLAEIAPDLQHPVLHRSIAQLLHQLPATGPNAPHAVNRGGPLLSLPAIAG